MITVSIKLLGMHTISDVSHPIGAKTIDKRGGRGHQGFKLNVGSDNGGGVKTNNIGRFF